MTEYQVSQLHLVVLLVAVVVVPLGSLAVARRQVAAPDVVFGVLVGALDAGGFSLAYFGAEGSLTPALQVLVNYLKDAPAGLIIVYVCLVQVRRYKAAKNNVRLRVWFRRAPYVVALIFFGGLAAELVIGPPVLESEEGLPATALFFESMRYVSFAAYAGLASFVFFGSIREVRQGLPSLNQRLQNLFGGIALAGLAVLSLHTLAWRATRTFLPEERLAPIVGNFSSQEVALVGLIAASFSASLFCHFRRSPSNEFADRFLSFLDLVSDLTEDLANVRVSKGKLRLPYASMHEASGEELLNLPVTDKRKLEIAFRIRAVYEQEVDGGGRMGRMSRRKLDHLTKLYGDELETPVLAEVLTRSICQKGLPGTLEDLLPDGATERGDIAVIGGGLREALALVSNPEDQDGGSVPKIQQAEWKQLVLVALADAGLLANGQKEETLSGSRGVSEDVLDAYALARYKMHNYGESEMSRRIPHAEDETFGDEEAD